ERKDDQGGRIHQRRQYSRAVIAVGVGRVGGSGVQKDGNQREQQGHEVRQVVSSFREQGERMGANARNHQQYDVGRGDKQRDAQYLGGALLAAMNVHVHGSSLRMTTSSFKTDSGFLNPLLFEKTR